MSVTSGTLGILGIVSSKMGDAGFWLDNGTAPPGKEALYGIKTGSGENLLNTSLGANNALGNNFLGTGLDSALGTPQPASDPAAASGVDANSLNTMLGDLLSTLTAPKPKTSSIGVVAQKMNMAEFGRVRPLEKPAAKSKPEDLTPLGTNGSE